MLYLPKVLDIIEMDGFVGSEQVYNGCRGQIVGQNYLFSILYVQPFKKIPQPPTISNNPCQLPPVQDRGLVTKRQD